MVTTTFAPQTVGTALFALAAIEAKLRDELVEAAKAEASIKGASLPSNPAQIKRVRAGGYNSAEGALGHLLPRLEKEWKKRRGANP